MRLSDLSAPARRGFGVLTTFARDPAALCRMTELKWGAWSKHALGVSECRRWRDGVACNSGHPGQVGHLHSTNGPAETQDRGAMHVHALMFAIVMCGS